MGHGSGHRCPGNALIEIRRKRIVSTVLRLPRLHAMQSPDSPAKHQPRLDAWLPHSVAGHSHVKLLAEVVAGGYAVLITGSCSDRTATPRRGPGVGGFD